MRSPGGPCPLARGIAAAFLALLLPSPSLARSEGEAHVEPRLEAGPRVRVLRLEGVESVPEGDLREWLFTESRPRWRFWDERPLFDEADVERDLARIAAFYRSRGFYESTARSELRWDDERAHVDVIFHVEEGPAVRVAARRIEIAPPLGGGPDERRLRSDLPIGRGDVFSLDDYGAARRELLARAAEAGHPRASIEGGAEVDAASREARIRWRLEPGPSVRFGAVRVTGLDRYEEELVRRELSVAEGDAYSLEAMRRTREQVQALGLFASVIVRPLPEESRTEVDGSLVWPVEVRVAERPPRSVSVGVGYGTDDLVRAQLRWQHRNWLGGARRFEMGLRYSSLERSADLLLHQPHFLAPGQSADVGLRLGRDTTPAYDAERLVAGFELVRPLAPPWTLRGGYEISWSSISSADRLADVFLEDPEQRIVLGALRFGARRSTVQDLLDPREGTWLDLSVAPHLAALGSRVEFVTLGAEGRAYHPMGSTVLAGRLRLGSIEPVGGSGPDEVPLVARFYAGGGRSLRGFAFQGLGPRTAKGKPVGGTSLLEASVELRFPIRRPLEGVVFVDAGQVDLAPHRWRLGDLAYAPGLGLRYHTPLGPVRLDFAFPLRAPPGADERFVFFSIGQSF
jgi:outer membrane protein assembly complex protein YaeT